ncbi:unnamed protein product [Darwinula stevensoni]|uniref:Uncharacterized protein n=1 Tax=Darwinula stevensoni TaxID=69355 RepID=A0A7R8XFW7_9CRUS|nr:unnamed protein product [Darwinula stevensoni]CAG0889171.1 unnamed protein product [Darwinula stevensoni]
MLSLCLTLPVITDIGANVSIKMPLTHALQPLHPKMDGQAYEPTAPSNVEALGPHLVTLCFVSFLDKASPNGWV